MLTKMERPEGAQDPVSRRSIARRASRRKVAYPKRLQQIEMVAFSLKRRTREQKGQQAEQQGANPVRKEREAGVEDMAADKHKNQRNASKVGTGVPPE